MGPCALLKSKEVDGIALGVHWEVDLEDSVFDETAGVKRNYGIYFSGKAQGKADHILYSKVDIDSNGTPSDVSNEDLCFTLTLAGKNFEVSSAEICDPTYGGPTCFDCTMKCVDGKNLALAYASATSATSDNCPTPYTPDTVRLVSSNYELVGENKNLQTKLWTNFADL